MVGKELGAQLVNEGFHLILVTRDPERAQKKMSFPCDWIKGDLQDSPLQDERLKDVEVVINLMGEPIADGRWSVDRKKSIFDSRVLGTRNLIASLQNCKNEKKPAFISVSAVGFYGDRKDEELDEKKSPGSDFLAEVCAAWEHEASLARQVLKSRVVILRLGVILSKQGGALEKMKKPFKFGLGGALGDGQQWMSWVHLQDVVRLIIWAIKEKSVEGLYNATSPEPVRNIDFSKALAACFGKKLFVGVPVFALKLALGEMSEALLFSQKAQPHHAQEQGFSFQFPDVRSALGDCLNSPKPGQ